MDGSQRDGGAALQGGGCGIRGFDGQLCGERRHVRERWPASEWKGGSSFCRGIMMLTKTTNEVKKSKRNFEHKLAQNIKPDGKSFYAYVRSRMFEIELDHWRTVLEI